jgi:response regulator RpfG family c-di-GMP phosphodiesterase
VEEAISYLQEHKGTQFDPQVIDAFLEHRDEIIAILNIYRE